MINVIIFSVVENIHIFHLLGNKNDNFLYYQCESVFLLPLVVNLPVTMFLLDSNVMLGQNDIFKSKKTNFHVFVKPGS